MNTFRGFALSALLCLGFASTSFADILDPGVHPDTTPQTGCASILTEWDAEQLRALQASGIYDNLDESRETGTYLVYLAFHVLRTTSGTGGIPQSQLDQAMLDLADAFAGSGICFTVALQDTINSSTWYTIDNDAERTALKGYANQANMIDCYFVNYDGGYCGVSSFTWSADQGITYDNGCVGVADNPSTFPHEIGHYFNLLHTHEPAYGTECPDGSNCGTAGDLVCDTPADPELGTGNVNTSCVYTGSSLIFCNGLVRSFNPDPENYMSYSRKTCRTQFSAGQRSRMIATLTSAPRWGEVGFYSPDFDFTTPAGWTNALVPRNTTGANSTSCAVTATLPGASNSTWLNQAMRQANSSSHNPGVYGRIHLDNEYFWWYSYGGGTWSGTQYYNNFGPITVRGGRHAIHSEVDYFDEVCESSESDNTRYTQWAWSPLSLAAGESLQRSTPPEKMTSTFTYPNCDGMQFTGTSWWSAVAIQPLTGTADFDVYLHQDYTGSTAGFQSALAVSAYGGNAPDWVIVNHNVAPYGGTYQAGIVNYDGESANVHLNRLESRTLNKNDGTRIVGTLASNQILDVFEVYFNATDIADTWTVTLTSPDAADLDLYIYPATGEYLTRGSYLESSQTTDSPAETLTLTASTDLPVSGWYSFVIGKDGLDDLGIEADYEVRFANGSNKLGINPPAAVQVAVVQDAAPWGGTEWTDQLTAQGIAYTEIPTASLAGTALDAYGVVIVPSPVAISSHDNILANIGKLDDYNSRGGVLVQGTATSFMTSGFTVAGGVQAAWEPCDVAHPGFDALTEGVTSNAPGSSAVHHVLTVPGGGWQTLATSDCGSAGACMVLNSAAGLLVYGAPMEHSEAFFDLSLGESIENIVRWAYKRARQTIRVSSTTFSPAVAVVDTYSKSVLTSVTYTNTESAAWLAVSPASGTIPVLDPSDPITFTFVPAGLPTGVHRADVNVAHTLYNDPETVYTYLNIAPRTPATPLDLDIAPVDFSAGYATVNVDWNPVTLDTNGLPLTVEYYNLYYSLDPYMATANVIDVYTTNLNLYFGNIGWFDTGFVRVTAIDSDGLLVADSNPDQPLPRTVAGDLRLLQGPVAGPAAPVVK